MNNNTNEASVASTFLSIRRLDEKIGKSCAKVRLAYLTHYTLSSREDRFITDINMKNHVEKLNYYR